MMVTFKEESMETFRNLFLKGYTDQHRGAYALYTKTDVYHHIRYAVARVNTFEFQLLFLLYTWEGYEWIMNSKFVFVNVFYFFYFSCLLMYSSQYMNLQNLTIGNYAYARVDGVYTPLSLCTEFYRNGSIFPGNETFDIDPHVDTGRPCSGNFPQKLI